MDNKTHIFWFSGTGNSLYAAKRLAEGLGGAELIRITGEAPVGAYGGEETKIGFVFPSYYCNMPRVVRAFVEKLEILPGAYIFAIVTMGGVGQGTADALRKAIEAKGLKLNYARGLHMPANYVIMYNPTGPEKSEGMLAKADTSIARFAAEITAGKELIRRFPYNGKTLYKDISALDAGFAAGEGCTGCGLCERVCPVRNIQMENGKPKWLGHCERCVACVSWCPENAIEYGDKTQGRRRYRNSRIKAADLPRK
ncbi:MAG: EFR1 family ferrodoxin [Clostridiales bacterium]|nr:EFR1 family ferrodoxin [Clostridiales bacterium]